jgi:hypothetical protein
LPADAAAGDGGQRQDVEAAEFGIAGKLQIPAIGGADVESAEIRKLAIEFVNDGLRLGGGDVEAAAVGENQTFLVQAQMHRVGAQPAGAGHGRSCDFAENPESGVSSILGKAESVAERRFERLRRPTRAAGCARSACSGRRRAARRGFRGRRVQAR